MWVGNALSVAFVPTWGEGPFGQSKTAPLTV